MSYLPAPLLNLITLISLARTDAAIALVLVLVLAIALDDHLGKEKGGKKGKSRLTEKKDKKTSSSAPKWKKDADSLGLDATYV